MMMMMVKANQLGAGQASGKMISNWVIHVGPIIELNCHLRKGIVIIIIKLRIICIHIFGIGLQLTCNRGSFGWMSLRRDLLLSFERTPCISLDCNLVPVQYQEYKDPLVICHLGALCKQVLRMWTKVEVQPCTYVIMYLAPFSSKRHWQHFFNSIPWKKNTIV